MQDQIEKEIRPKTLGLGNVKSEGEPNSAQEYIPDVKATINAKAQVHCDIAHDLNVLYNMLPTEMTRQQSKSLNKILSALNI